MIEAALVGASKEAPLELSDFSFFAFAMGYLPVGAVNAILAQIADASPPVALLAEAAACRGLDNNGLAGIEHGLV